MTPGDQDAQRRWQRVCTILDAVFDAPDAERGRVLDELCAGDAALLAEVEAMLAAEVETDPRVDAPIGDWAGEVLAEVEEDAEAVQAYSPGELIGGYRLVRELGRGGMGAVWLAERTGEEFSQQVALKLLKRGLDTDAVLRRFYDERRILARLRHPHIALFLDGGVSDSGQPWFTMEWVDGAPITEWCDARNLGIRERVTLFLGVVAAVQYAHQQLVVHRDLKPGNVLVSELGEVKLLDFGIARMLDTTEGSVEAATMTRMGVRMLTPAYAAPEQLRGDAATTTTDVYALGVLLGELLSGKRPLPRSRETADAPLPKPSSQADAAAAELRGTSLERLRRQLRGDLDTIVLKAVGSEPSRRYGSAQAFGEDLQRWLDGQPVQARPESAWYRTRRFIGRHRLGTAAAALVVLSLAAGVLMTTWQAREANRQALEARRQAAEAERQTRRAEEVQDFLVGIFQASDPKEWKGSEPTVADLLEIGTQRVDELGEVPVLRAQMQRVIGEIFVTRGEFARAEPLLRASMDTMRRDAGERSKDYADTLHVWGNLLYLQGDYRGATEAIEQVVDILRDTYRAHLDNAQALSMLASLRQVSGRLDEAVDLRKQAVAITRDAQGHTRREYAEQLLELGQLLLMVNRIDEASAWLDRSLEVSRATYGPDSTMFARAIHGQARLMSETGELARAASGFGQAAAIFREARAYQELGVAVTNEGNVLCRMGRFADADHSYREALQTEERFASRNQIDILKRTRGRCLSDAGWFDQAEPYLRDAVGFPEHGEALDRNFVLGGAGLLIRLLVRQGRLPEALALVDRVERTLGPVAGTDGWHAAVYLTTAAQAWFADGDRDRGLAVLEGAIRDLRQADAPARTILAAELDLAELELQSGRARSAEVRLRGIADHVDGGRQGPVGLRAEGLRGAALLALGRGDEAEPLLRGVLEARSRMYGDDGVWTDEARLYLGACLYRTGKPDQGRALIQRGRERFVRASGTAQLAVRLADEAASDSPSMP